MRARCSERLNVSLFLFRRSAVGARRVRRRRRAASRAGSSPRGTACCSPVFISLMVTTPRARSSPPTTATRGIPAAAAYLNCFPSLSGSGYTSTRSAAVAQLGAPAAARRRRLRLRTGSRARRRAASTSDGNMPRSAITTRMRSRPSEKPQAGMSSPRNMPIRPSYRPPPPRLPARSGTAISMIAPV